MRWDLFSLESARVMAPSDAFEMNSYRLTSLYPLRSLDNDESVTCDLESSIVPATFLSISLLSHKNCTCIIGISRDEIIKKIKVS